MSHPTAEQQLWRKHFQSAARARQRAVSDRLSAHNYSRCPRSAATTHTDTFVHIALMPAASCFSRSLGADGSPALLCEPYRVWSAHRECWPEVNPVGYSKWNSFREVTQARSDTSALPMVLLNGSFYLLESFAFVANFAHCLLQFIPKIGAYMALMQAQRSSPMQLLVPRHRHTVLVAEFLALFNLSYTILEDNRHYIVERLTVSEISPMHFAFAAKTVDILRAPVRLLPITYTVSETRIFLRRESQANATLNNNGVGNSRNLQNADELSSALRYHSFTTAYTSALSLRERVSLFANLSTLVTQHGTNELNLFFANAQGPSCVVILVTAGGRVPSPIWSTGFKTLWPAMKVHLLRNHSAHNVVSYATERCHI